ncbi:DUF4876 domain-containing protein [Marinifilum caeruleilacunae]|uniref:DUF4876 domain-containing protein n=1 Tax=Marinifilum caeruleilacunae TaxID=2499076 RepID=A0ABX1WQL4_9BACT|nr:DUF4876 domain-containing protein [Marinifilum caeruleilacunae]NOU58382.1 DUF4876 domain-containing protein [Marinifilum caeruleilacunae]
MKKLIFGLSLLMVVSLFSCSDDDNEIPVSYLTIQLNTPDDIETSSFYFGDLTVTNVNSGEEIVMELNGFEYPAIDLEEGIYNFLIAGEIDYYAVNADGNKTLMHGAIRGLKENVSIEGGEFGLDIDLFVYSSKSDFVISEIFFADTKTPEGDPYLEGDQYFELYNNTSKVLYADGLCIGETEFQTVDKLVDLSPDNRNEFTPVRAVYRIPGNGTDYPVQPGESILISDIAINHISDNANSFDLSGSDFEWFDGADIDVDVPEVPNMIKMVSASTSVWHLHNRGYNSYILFRMNDVTPEAFTSDYAYHYDYKFVFGDLVFDMDNDAWEVPNDAIIDAVGCSTPSEYQWKAMSPTLDLTWTHSGDGDDTRYGKSVKRKVSYVEADGRVVLMDTNNSAVDFIPTAMPSPGVIETE